MIYYNCLLSFVLSRVDSDHNRKVVHTIIKEIGTDKFTEKQIKGIVLTRMFLNIIVCMFNANRWC